MNEQQKKTATAALEKAFLLSDSSYTKMAARITPYKRCLRQQVYDWRQRGCVGAHYAIAAERAFKGLITRYEFRPDIFDEI